MLCFVGFLCLNVNWGIKGAALAISLSYWVNVIMLVIYINSSTACASTWNGVSKEALNDVVSFLKLTVASAVMICLEYWSFEMVVLLSGLLPNPQLETSVLSISLNTCWDGLYDLSWSWWCHKHKSVK
ncbi:unnamed protein product [Vicia faba]|uniref:Uncharacterized protein n=1 Tax=Vicia faba TaxID=3906 RepID=A0AAV1A6Z0_VICFA|nr:unnamed protein product [Vicia faba]